MLKDPNQNPIQYDATTVDGYSDPDTGMRFPCNDFYSLFNDVVRHRQSNNLPAERHRVLAMLICHQRRQRGLPCDEPFTAGELLKQITGIHKAAKPCLLC